MKKMAIFIPGYVPVPAVKGGAVEMLIEFLIQGNEQNGDYYIDLFTVPDEHLKQIKYQHTSIIEVSPGIVSHLVRKRMEISCRLFGSRNYASEYAINLKYKVDFNKYDIVLIENNMRTYHYLLRELRNTKAKIIFHLHNDIDAEDKPKYLAEEIAKTADEVLCVSQFIKNRFDSVTGSQFAKVLYNAIDTTCFSARHDFDERRDTKVVLYVGRLDKNKGFEPLLYSFDRLVKTYKNLNVKLWIIGEKWMGDSSEYQALELLKDEELKEKIEFKGYIPNNQLYKYYSAASVVVVPSMCEEAFGLVAIEALLMNCPLIVTDSGALPEIVGDAAYIVKRNRDLIENLSTALFKVLTDDTTRYKLIENGKMVLERHDYFRRENYFREFKRMIEG